MDISKSELPSNKKFGFFIITFCMARLCEIKFSFLSSWILVRPWEITSWYAFSQQKRIKVTYFLKLTNNLIIVYC